MKNYKMKAVLSYMLILAIVSSSMAYTKLTEKRMNSLHPEFAKRLEKGLSELEQRHPKYEGVEIYSGYRTFAQQDVLFKKGITPARGGRSYHNYALAADIAPRRNGRYVFNDWNFWRDANRIMGKYGLETGLNWRRPDANHVQIPSSKVPIKRLRENYAKNGLAEVFLDVDAIYGRSKRRSDIASAKPRSNKTGKKSNRYCD